jgi:hypothetical protein
MVMTLISGQFSISHFSCKEHILCGCYSYLVIDRCESIFLFIACLMIVSQVVIDIDVVWLKDPLPKLELDYDVTVTDDNGEVRSQLS